MLERFFNHHPLLQILAILSVSAIVGMGLVAFIYLVAKHLGL